MRPSKILILIAVGLLVFGSAAFFGYTLFIKPYSSFTFFHKKQTPVVAAPTPDPSQAGFDTALALQKAGKMTEAQTAWQTWLADHPNAPKKKEAMEYLGKINMEVLCSPSTTANKSTYTVVKGDSLDRIARKQKSNPELIQRINGLPNINLQIGQVLVIPEVKTSVELDRQQGLMIVRNNDQFLKSYPLLSFPPMGAQKNPVETVVIDRIATVGNKRTAFGDKKYPESEQIIILRSCGNIVTPPNSNTAATTTTPADTTAATAVTPVMPPGFVLSDADMREIFPFITKNTPVTVH